MNYLLALAKNGKLQKNPTLLYILYTQFIMNVNTRISIQLE